MAISGDTGSGPALELKGRMSTLTVLRLLDPAPQRVLALLDERMADAPAMFTGMPVILDASGLAEWPEASGLQALIDGLRSRGVAPVGLTGSGAEELAPRVGLGVVPASADSGAGRVAPAAEPPASESGASAAGRVVRQPVRSGQQIYARGGDLVVMATVSPGAEVMADGHIHVYGALNGRAMAGVRGDRDACIFCRRFNAELVAVAGHYQVSDQFSEADRGGEVRIGLRDDDLTIEPMPGTA
jgi:septum site-determining protein MinC